MQRLFFSFLIIILISIPAMAEDVHCEPGDDYMGALYTGDSLNMTMIGGEFSGPTNDIIVKDTIAFMGNGGYLTILNIKDNSNPVLISNTKIPGVIECMDWEPGQIFASLSENGVVLVDVNDLNNPFVLSSYETIGYSYGLDAVDSLVYVAIGSFGFLVINFSDPYNPVQENSYNTVGYCSKIDIIDTIGFFSCGASGLEIINIANPDSIEQISVIDSVDFVENVCVVDSLVFIADDDDGLRIWDISDLFNPVSLGTYDTSNKLYDVDVSDTVAYLAYTYSGFITVNVSDPTSPVIMDQCACNDYLESVCINGAFAYTADRNAGLTIYNVTDPNSIAEEAHYRTGNSSDYIELSDSLLFVTQAANGFRIFDISNPQLPIMLTDVDDAGYIRGLTLDGNILYAIGTSFISSYDFSDPANPVKLDQINFYLPYWGAVRDTLLYGAFDNGLRILDIANPSNLFEIGSCLNYSNTRSIELIDTFAYVTDLDSGFVVYSVNDPVNPYVINSYDPGGYTLNATIEDTFAYVCEGVNDLTILSIANLDSIYEITTLNIYFAYHAQVIDSLLYLAESRDGIGIYDISDPSSPVEVGRYDTGNGGEHVIVDGETVYLSDNNDGFYIFRYPLPPIPQHDLYGTVGLSDSPADSSDSYVTVVEMGLADTTDIHGYYEFLSLNEGTYTLIYSHMNYDPDTIIVVLDTNKTVDATLDPVINYYNITGTVGLSDNPADSSNTFISLMEASLIDTTDMHGYYEFLGVEEGVYTLIYWHNTYQGDTIIDTLDSDHVIDLTLTKLAGIRDYMNMPVLSNVKTTDHVEFLYSKKVEGISSIGIYDVTGRNIYSRDIRDMGLYSISTSVMPQGIYFLHIREEGNTYKRKVGIIK